VSFLTEAHLYDSKDQHRQAVSWQAFEQRRHARADFHGHPKAAEYEEKEDHFVPGQQLEEPLVSE
jgi:hypothetical protein